MPKNAIEPSPKFDSHVSKSANRITSLLSYRAFELTQVNAGSPLFADYGHYVAKVTVLSHSACSPASIVFLAIFFWVRIWWDQGPAQARVPLRCHNLSVQRQGSGCCSNGCTQVEITPVNGEKLFLVTSLCCCSPVSKYVIFCLFRFNIIPPEGSKGKASSKYNYDSDKMCRRKLALCLYKLKHV